MSSSKKSEDWALEQAPSRYEYNRMMEGIEENIDGEMGLQCKFVLVTLGELGLRAGELAHISQKGSIEWINFRRKEIKIPKHSPCECGYCEKQAQQKAGRTDGVTFQAELKERWKPKTEAAIRTVPFHYSDEIQMIYREFFNKYDEWPRSRVSVNRRVDRIIENSDLNRNSDTVNPQTLRACAANYHAKCGMNPEALADLMGWSNKRTALKFYQQYNDGVRSELSRCHGAN